MLEFPFLWNYAKMQGSALWGIGVRELDGAMEGTWEFSASRREASNERERFKTLPRLRSVIDSCYCSLRA